MNKTNEQDRSKHSFTGLGLVFGTALGAAICPIISCSIFWAGVGTGLGLILGAIADSQMSKR